MGGSMQGKRLARLVCCVVSALFAAHVCAAEPALTPLSPKPPVSATPSPAKPNVLSQHAQIWNLKDADIRAVIQTISILTGKNFIIDPRVQGKVTLVSQKPMAPAELYQVFLSMLQLLQFSAVPAGDGVIKIVPSADANALSDQVATNTKPGAGDEIVVRVVSVNHVSATELVPVLRPLMSQTSNVSAYLPSNSLILAGTASNISRLVQVVQQMDNAQTNQVSVIPLKHANAKKVVSILKALQTGNAAQGGVNNTTVVFDEENNSVLVSGNTVNQLMMRRLIDQLDQQGAGGDDTKVVSLSYLTAKKLAPILQKIAQGMNASTPVSKGGKADADATTSAAASSITVQAEEDSNALIIHAPSSMMMSLLKIIHQLDTRPDEVLVEAIVVKVDENLLDKLGIEWGSPSAPLNGITQATSIAASATGAGGSSLPSINTVGDFAAKINNNGVGLLPDGNLMAILHMLKQDGSTDVLATPSVAVLNNGKAVISDGQNVGVANRSYQGVTPTPGATENIIAPYNTIQRQDVTLSLEVSPHISPNNMIRMDLDQRNDSLASTNNLSASATDNENPTINTAKIKTSVMVKSGDILVLGGLINNQQQKTTEKIPILGDIPLLGRFFSYKTTTVTKTSLMIFIRPVILSKDTAKAQTLARYNYIRQQQIELETRKLSELDLGARSVLPTLDKKHDVVLPLPVTTTQLPQPTKTAGKKM